MISKFFIDRPIFATVLSIVITLAGAIALVLLPLALYPPISPPTVSVDCSYPGASAQVVSESVATPIEQQVNGVENMLYMSSQCTNDGAYNLTVTFKHGVNLNMAQVLVQNRVALALPNLPDVLKQSGVNVRKRSPDILMSIAINSPLDKSDPLYRNQLYLSNYALMHVKDELVRLPGVSDVNMLGQRDYSMRVWVDPDRLSSRNMTAGDVVAAIRAQNAQVASGQIGQQPVPGGQLLQIPLNTLGRLVDVEQFENIVVKAMPDGRVTRVKDIGRVELGSKNEDISGQVNSRPSVSLAIFQLPDANALDTADMVKAKIKVLEADFPPGVAYEIRYDTTPFIRESIGEVFKTLREAVILVAVVVLLFLQNWRSAVIPLVAVPVAIIGTFAVMALFGFSLNNLTLFGLVLAIGIVVDDAIVVVEAVEHHIEHGMKPRDATIRAMDEVSGPVIAIGLVLSAVFIPCAFISGIVGQFFRQFALTIATSTIISAFVSLTLSPALAAMLLRSREEEGRSRRVLPTLGYGLILGWMGWELVAPWILSLTEKHIPGNPPATPGLFEPLAPPLLGVAAWLSRQYPFGYQIGGEIAAAVGCAVIGILSARPLDWLLSQFFRLFNLGFKSATRFYGRLVAGTLRVSALVLIVYLGLVGMTYWGLVTTPGGFIPSQDMGYLLINVQLPDSTSAERTRGLMTAMEKIVLNTEGVKFTQAMSGQSLLLSANGSNFGSMFVILDEFSKRPNPVIDRFFAWYDETLNYLGEDLLSFELTVNRRLLRRAPRSHSSFAVRLGDLLVIRLLDRITETTLDGRLKRWTGPPPNSSGKPSPSYLEARTRKWFGALKKPSLYGDAVAKALREKIEREVDGATVTILGPPPVRGVGRAGGFKIMVEDRGDNGPEVLQGQTENLNDRLKAQPELVGMTSVFRANVPQFYVDVDRAACLSKEVRLKDLFDTMRIYLGSLYVNDFNRFGRTWQVIVQADPHFRNKREDIERLKVRNAKGAMVPLAALAKVREVNGPLVLTRYNMYPAAALNGSAAPGTSSGQAIALVQSIADRELLSSMSTEWTELAYLELQAGNVAMYLFGVAVIMVFLVLAAQYESWSLPLAVILVVPMCLLSAIAGVRISFQDINIFTQIGFVVLVGLASKNAILIVEFAKKRRDQGESRTQSALDACILRLRPIVMTSLAFILGVLPLILGQGAGAEMRRTLGTTVFSGMLGVTIFGLVLTPVFFVVTDRLGSARVFHAGPLREAGDVILWILRFGWLFPLLSIPFPRPSWKRPSTAEPGRKVPANGNGHAMPVSTLGHGNVNGNGVDHPPVTLSDTERN